MCVCVQSIIKVPAAPDDSKQVVSWLHDARLYSLCHALNAMQWAEYCQGPMTPDNNPTACSKRHALCVAAMHYVYAMQCAEY